MPAHDIPTSSGCPAWCRRDHDLESRTGEEDHVSEATWLPVLMLLRAWNVTPRALHVESTDLAVEIVQPNDAAEPRLSVAEAERQRVRGELSIESGHRLIRAMAEQLDKLSRATTPQGATA